MSRIILLTSLLVLATACDSTTDPDMPSVRPEAEEQLIVADGDSALVAQSLAMPGYAGSHLADDGHPVVSFTRGSSERVRLMAARTASELLGTGAPSEIREVRYDFASLKRWQVRVRPALEALRIVSLDADELTNTVRVVVSSADQAAEVSHVARSLGLPADAVSVAVLPGGVTPFALLTDMMRPLTGGLQIYRATSSGSSLSGTCTIGVPANRSGVAGFVTNSHCTAAMTGVEGTQFLQGGTALWSHRVGVEVVDPAWKSGSIFNSCKSGYTCRNSDAAWVKIEGVTASLGRISRPSIRYADGGTYAASTVRTINSSSPTLTVNSVRSGAPIIGQSIDKIGALTGWTYGKVTFSCVDVYRTDNTQVKCSDQASVYAYQGDSGSPVFSWNGAGLVELFGLLHAGNSASKVMFYSRMDQVAKDLGTLTYR